MRKKPVVYWDCTPQTNGDKLFVTDSEVELVAAGAPLFSMSVESKTEEYAFLEKQGGIHFLFDDAIPLVEFFPVPFIEIFAWDEKGGFLGTLNAFTGLEEEAPICYIDAVRNCFTVAANSETFVEILRRGQDWRSKLRPNGEVTVYRSKVDAAAYLEFAE